MCIQVENGRKDSDIRPKIASRKKILDMDEAISRTKFGMFNYAIIFVSGLIIYAVAMETIGIVYIIPVLKCDLTVTTTQMGILGGAGFFGVICSSHLFGYLADTKGRHRIIQPTLSVAVLLSIICSFLQSVYALAALRFLNGFFMSGSAANIFAYLGEFHNNSQRSRAIMGAAVICSSLFMLLPVAAWTVINQDWQFQVPLIDITYKPWRLFMVVCAIPGLLSAIALIFLPESPKFVLLQGNNTGAYQILQKMNRWNNGKNSEIEEFEIREEIESIDNKLCTSDVKKSQFPLLKSMWNQTVPLFKPPYLKPTILLCIIQFGTYLTSNGFFMFFAEIINRMSTNLDSFVDQRIMMCDVINMKADNISTIAYSGDLSGEICKDKLESSTLENGFALELVYAVGSAVAGLLINRVGKFPIIFFVLLTTGLSGIGCMITDIPALQITLFIWFLACSISVNVVSSATIDLYPTTLRAMAISISLMFGRLGAVCGSNAAAILLDNHCETSFYLAGSILIAMSVLAFFIPNIHQKTIISDHDQKNCDPRLSILSLRGQ